MRRELSTSFAVGSQGRPGPPESHLRIGILGPLVLIRDRSPVTIAPAMVRNLLALLALHPHDAVTRDDIVAALWDGDPPATSANLIHVYVSRLRAQLRSGPDEPDPIVRGEHGGYRLCLPPGSIDLGRFDRALSAGRAAAQSGDTGAALEQYAEALHCWRGTVLSDLNGRFAQLPAAVAAQRRRVEATVEYAGLCAAVERHSEAADALRLIAPSEPLHEGICAALMVALAGLGDRAAAVAEFTAMRKRLRDELGIDPGADLQMVNLMVVSEGGLDTGVRPPAERPVVERPVVERPVVERPVVERPVVERPAADQPAVGRPGVGRPAVVGSAGDGSDSAPTARPRRRGRRPAGVVAAGLAVVLVAAGGGVSIDRYFNRPPAAPAPRPVNQGLVFAPIAHRWRWAYGPSLGVTRSGVQEASSYVYGLGDHDHNAGFRLRVRNDLVEGPDAGVLVAFSGNSWKVEGDDEGDNSDIVPPAASEGRLTVSVTAEGVISMTFDGAPVMSYKLEHNLGGRGITPSVWQNDKGAVRMTQIVSNAS